MDESEPGARRAKASKTAPRGPTLRQRVALCSADRMEPSVIAAVLGISEDRLRVEFSVELEHGAAIVRAQHLAALSTAARCGSSPAAKALLAVAAKPEPEKPTRSQGSLSVEARALRIIRGDRK